MAHIVIVRLQYLKQLFSEVNKGCAPDPRNKNSVYVSEEGLGGIMFWTIDNDDFRGACHDRPFPLIEAAKEALYGRLNAQV